MSEWQLPRGYQGLIFDCDGTLVDSMPLHYQAWNTVMTRHQLEFTETRFYQWAGVPVDEIIRRLAVEQGKTVDIGALAAERDACFHSLPASELRPVTFVVDIVRCFYGKRPMAVATGSTKESAEASLRAIGILAFFDAVISSRGTCPPKPAPDVFLIAAKQLGIAPEKCVAFEDAEAGLQAARSAGMHVVDVRPWIQR
ncbi:MAG: HAD-IA family hydrolase [SAR324 cluster bacterium]|nr:HAD-IA family hydrolase [SAR324 cluster bacterium]